MPGTRVKVIPTVFDPSGIPISTNPPVKLHPAVAGDGNDFFVVWEDDKRVKPSFCLRASVVFLSDSLLHHRGTEAQSSEGT